MALILKSSTVERVHIPPRIYQGTLVEVRVQKMPDLDNPGQERDNLVWAFEVARKGKDPVTLEAITSMAFGPKSSARKYAKALMAGTEPPTTMDIEDLYGHICQVKVDDKTREGEVYSRVTDAFAIVPDEDEEDDAPPPPKPAATRAPAARREPARAPDGEEIPY